MSNTTDTGEYAQKVSRVVDVRIECESPYHLTQWVGKQYGTPEYWETVADRMKDWVKDFHDFMRDHRSQDSVRLNVVADKRDQCSLCGATWETVPGDENNESERGLVFCASCGTEVKEETL